MQYSTSIVYTTLNKIQCFKSPARKQFQRPRNIFKPVSLPTSYACRLTFKQGYLARWGKGKRESPSKNLKFPLLFFGGGGAFPIKSDVL